MIEYRKPSDRLAEADRFLDPESDEVQKALNLYRDYLADNSKISFIEMCKIALQLVAVAVLGYVLIAGILAL